MHHKERPQPIMEAREITKVFPAADGGTLLANDMVSVAVHRGKTLGIVGESGCGKSTLAKILVHLEAPTAGEIYYAGQPVTTLRGESLRKQRRHVQMIFQDPTTAFNPKGKVKDIICEPLLNFKCIKKREVDVRARELLREVELPESYAERYAHNMSGGQRQRIGIARAISLNPEVLICDEATCALDVSVQKNIIELLMRMKAEHNLGIVFICHDIALVKSISDEMVVMYHGNIVEKIAGRDIGRVQVHPYTTALIDAVFSLDMDFSKPLADCGFTAETSKVQAKGCIYANRCPHCRERCLREKPQLRERAPGHQVACHLFEEEKFGTMADSRTES